MKMTLTIEKMMRKNNRDSLTFIENDYCFIFKLRIIIFIIILKMAKNIRNQKDSGWSIENFLKSVDFYRVMPREMTEPSLSGASSKIILDKKSL